MNLIYFVILSLSLSKLNVLSNLTMDKLHKMHPNCLFQLENRVNRLDLCRHPRYAWQYYFYTYYKPTKSLSTPLKGYSNCRHVCWKDSNCLFISGKQSITGSNITECSIHKILTINNLSFPKTENWRNFIELLLCCSIDVSDDIFISNMNETCTKAERKPCWESEGKFEAWSDKRHVTILDEPIVTNSYKESDCKQSCENLPDCFAIVYKHDSNNKKPCHLHRRTYQYSRANYTTQTSILFCCNYETSTALKQCKSVKPTNSNSCLSYCQHKYYDCIKQHGNECDFVCQRCLYLCHKLERQTGPLLGEL